MPTYVVLLRGVNVGKAKRVPMAALRAVLLELGCTRVATLLNSGNAVVDHPKTTPQALGRTIAAAMESHFGFDVPVVVKSRAEFNAVVSGQKLEVAPEDHSRLLVAFTQTQEAMASLAPLSALVSAPDRLQLEAQAAYLHCAGGILESKAADALLGKLGKAVTTRNWATVLKLQALAGQRAT